MIIEIFLSALALLLIAEGILPFLSPNVWRRMLLQATASQDSTVRILGFVSLIVGAIIMVLVHSGIL